MILLNENEDYISKNYNKVLTKNISDVVGCSVGDIVSYCKEIGIEYKKKAIMSDFDSDYICNEIAYRKASDIAKDVGLTCKQVDSWARNHSHNYTSKRHVVDSEYFNSIDTNRKAYWLGFIYADGWICRNKYNGSVSGYEFGVELSSIDSYLLYQLRDDLHSDHIIKTSTHTNLIYHNKKETTSASSVFRVFSKNIVENLHNNGIDFNKTYTGEFPKVDDDLFIPFLKGYIDGDGCIHHIKDDRIAVHITSCTRDILDYINESTYRTLGIKAKIYDETDTKHRIYWFRKKDVKILLDTLYSYDDTPCLKRKKDIYESFYSLAAQ